LKEGGYYPFDTKKFGYARNCLPVLVGSKCDQGRLVPCSLPPCPFCWSRRVVIKACKLLEPHKNTIDTWRWGCLGFQAAKGDIDELYGAMHKATDTLPVFDGLITNVVLWSTDTEYKGAVLYMGVGSQDASNPVYTEAKKAPRAIGEAFTYPAFLWPPGGPKSYVYETVQLWNVVKNDKFRAFRTRGIFYNSGVKVAPERKKSKEDRFNDINKRLTALESKLDEVLLSNESRGQHE
jgi:hypothetical protein